MIIAVWFLGWGTWYRTEEKIRPQDAPATKKDSFLDLFQPIPTDTFSIFPHSRDEEAEGYRFKGRRIDTSFAVFLKGKYSLDRIEEFRACFKHRISDRYFLLLFRSPGEFFTSPVSIMIWDKDLGEIADLLASVGRNEETAGYSFYSTTLLTINKEEKIMQLEKRSIECDPAGDVYSGEEYETVCDTVVELYVLEGSRFKLK